MAINLYKHIYKYLAAIRESVSNPPWTHLAPSSTVCSVQTSEPLVVNVSLVLLLLLLLFKYYISCVL